MQEVVERRMVDKTQDFPLVWAPPSRTVRRRRARPLHSSVHGNPMPLFKGPEHAEAVLDRNASFCVTVLVDASFCLSVLVCRRLFLCVGVGTVVGIRVEPDAASCRSGVVSPQGWDRDL